MQDLTLCDDMACPKRVTCLRHTDHSEIPARGVVTLFTVSPRDPVLDTCLFYVRVLRASDRMS
jgi:hypothetical protein